MKRALPFAILIFVVLGCTGVRPVAKDQPNRSNTNAPQVVTSDAERLATAKDLIRDSKDLSSYETAEIHLRAIDKKSPQYSEAQKILQTVEKEKDKLRKAQAKQLTIEQKDKRKEIIAKLERKLLDQGMDFYFSFEGKNEEVLRIKYVLMSRPVVHNITNNTDFLSNMSEVGVKKVIFTDGYDESWSYDL